MTHLFKKLVYHAAKWAGLFWLARSLTRRDLRILAYHGLAIADEDRFRERLFIDLDKFRRRMTYLVASGYRVLALEEALERLRRGDLPDRATVITFDDGFYSIWALASPVLRELDLPYTVYVTTYYSIKENPVFRLAVQYMFWKTSQRELDLTGLGLQDTGSVELVDEGAKDVVAWKIIRHGESAMEESQRVELCRKLGDRLGIDYDQIRESRFLSLMTAGEILDASRSGVDIELHTHRHVLPESSEGASKEIEDNRRVLESLTGTTKRHFCFPSGIFCAAHIPVLAAMGMASAATCKAGLVRANRSDAAPVILLSRFLDGNNISAIEFEAELSGFAELMRGTRKLYRSEP